MNRPLIDSAQGQPQLRGERLISHQSQGCHHPRQELREGTQETFSETTAIQSTSGDSQGGQLQPVYHSPRQAKYFALMLIQDLVQICGYGVFPYCFMVEILADLVFEGCSDVGLKVAITVFLIGSKYFDSKGPRVDDLLQWARNRISKDEVLECEAAICQGFDYQLPDFTSITLEEATDICLEIEAEIFNLP